MYATRLPVTDSVRSRAISAVPVGTGTEDRSVSFLINVHDDSTT